MSDEKTGRRREGYFRKVNLNGRQKTVWKRETKEVLKDEKKK